MAPWLAERFEEVLLGVIVVYLVAEADPAAGAEPGDLDVFVDGAEAHGAVIELAKTQLASDLRARSVHSHACMSVEEGYAFGMEALAPEEGARTTPQPMPPASPNL